ncbi:serine/threonine-protein kinase Nek10-like isoform X2 [Phyllopteryx taeniolatus]|uniref:serine/threonine-protein kinase Nek10-like isoform X2 n=1 Tax=Phyllopteryx taeniolatus TaxID=161469 RepID=UPI002AD3759A|nr:serine/threonine-protein kinase Nek10-like isoform X2 [Phyllopteryx taeniolatus]
MLSKHYFYISLSLVGLDCNSHDEQGITVFFRWPPPNIVKYYKTFLEDDKLYIVMELIEGVPLLERCNSLKEKQQSFIEERIWNIFILMCQALRYLHKDKRIVHRDLTPNIIMLGEEEKVTIIDFGLAKQKQENSKMTSVKQAFIHNS